MRAAVFSLALALVLVTATGCYSPTLVDGKAHCASGGVCPQGQYCAGNGLCYDNGHPPPDAGVPGDGGAHLLVPNARLSTVTPDETVLAYFTNTTSVEGTIVGDFTVAHMATPTTPLFTDHGAFEGMSPSVGVDAIYYFVSPAPSVDNGSNTVYGKLKVWTPTLTAPIVVSSGYATTYAIARDFSWVLFIDAAIPSATAVGNLVLARAQDCSGTVCPTTTLATNVVVAPSSVSYGNNPTYVAYITQSGSTVVTYQVFLANTATGTTVPVGGSTTTIPWLNFTPDGSLLGIGTTTFTAIATATAQPAAWSIAPLGTTRVEVVALRRDAQTFYIRVSQPSGTHIWKTTAAATTQLSTSAASYFQIPITSTAATASGAISFRRRRARSAIWKFTFCRQRAPRPFPSPPPPTTTPWDWRSIILWPAFSSTIAPPLVAVTSLHCRATAEQSAGAAHCARQRQRRRR